MIHEGKLVMKFHKIKIEGFRKLNNVELQFGDATFCIGSNNTGKSSLLAAIEYLLTSNKKLPSSEFYSQLDADTGTTCRVADKVVFEAVFNNLPEESDNWTGFKGRVFKVLKEDGSFDRLMYYRKTYEIDKDVVIDVKSKKRSVKSEYLNCLNGQLLIDAGADKVIVSQLFPDLNKSLTKNEKTQLEENDEFVNLEDEDIWDKNPGGFMNNMLSKLPKFIRIPIDSSSHELEDPKKGVLHLTLNELFAEVRENSKHYEEAKKHLSLLANDLNPENAETEFGKMMEELNSVLSGVFPDTKLHAKADLSDPKVLIPNFSVEMTSNIRTAVSNQGTGMVRAAVFGLLRFRQRFLDRRQNRSDRNIIIGFEEPEIYLHPCAANQMRETIYNLASSNSQILCTTHSPYMIDLSRKDRQVLNSFKYVNGLTHVTPFSVSDAFRDLQENDKDYVKMLMKIDDYVARIFFADHIVVVEGDSEDIAIRRALELTDRETQNRIKNSYEVIKARGKATIIGLLRYMNAMHIEYTVIHDADMDSRAENLNNPIKSLVVDNCRVFPLLNCLEDILGYKPPTKEKPFRVFKVSNSWANWNDIPEEFRNLLCNVFNISTT